MYRNRWPECSGMGGRNGAELVAGIKRNMHLVIDLFIKNLTKLEEKVLGSIKSGDSFYPKLFVQFNFEGHLTGALS